VPLDSLFKKRVAISQTRRRPADTRRADRTLADMPRWIEKVKALPDIRWNKVAEIREALASGQYDIDTRCQDMLDHPSDELATLDNSKL